MLPDAGQADQGEARGRLQLMRDHRLSGIVVLAAAVMLPGCAGSALPELPKLALPTSVYSETPTEIYTRIARGALTCWFGGSGPLKGAYIFHADVAPPSENAGAEIVIYTRDTSAPSPRSLRAYRITIARVAEGALVTPENLKIAEPLATSMQADVKRWAGGGAGCNSTLPEAWVASSDGASPGHTGTVPVSHAATRSR